MSFMSFKVTGVKNTLNQKENIKSFFDLSVLCLVLTVISGLIFAFMLYDRNILNSIVKNIVIWIMFCIYFINIIGEYEKIVNDENQDKISYAFNCLQFIMVFYFLFLIPLYIRMFFNIYVYIVGNTNINKYTILVNLYSTVNDFVKLVCESSMSGYLLFMLLFAFHFMLLTPNIQYLNVINEEFKENNDIVVNELLEE